MSSPTIIKLLPPDPEYLLNEMLQNLFHGLKAGANSVTLDRPEISELADLFTDKDSLLVFAYIPEED
jgi:hypothetical protein